PPLPRPLHARPRHVPALPQHRRLVPERALPALVSGDLPQAARQSRAAPRAGRRTGVDRGAALLPRAAVHSAELVKNERAAAPGTTTAGSATITPSRPASWARYSAASAARSSDSG